MTKPVELKTPGSGDSVTAISLREPWASLMRTGAKTMETRHWPTSFRGHLLICASKRQNRGELRELRDLLRKPAFQVGLAPLFDDPHLPLQRLVKGRLVDQDNLLYGNAVALVFMYDCVPVESPSLGDVAQEAALGNYASGRYAWKTRGLQRFKPFPVVGKRGFFSVTLPSGFVSFRAGA